MDIGVSRVANMEQRPPCFAMTVDGKLLVLPGMEREYVDDQVKPHSRPEPEDRALAEQDRNEEGILVGDTKQLNLCQPLGLAVVRSWCDRHVLSHGRDVRFIRGRRSVIDRPVHCKELTQRLAMASGLCGSQPG